MSRLPVPTLFVLALLSSSCSSGDADGAWQGTVTDSAGVSLVRNPASPLWTEGLGWTVEEELSIGSLDADAEYQFGQIIGVDVDGAGNVYVADGQARNVRVFDATGAWMRTIGSPGSGPGELGLAMNGVFVVGEHLVVPDLGNGRVNTYGVGGDFVRSQRLDLAKGIPFRWDLTSGGRLVAQTRNLNPTDTTAGRSGDPITTLPDEGEAPDTVAILPMGESFQIRNGQARVRFFEPEPIWDADPSGRLVTARNSAMRFSLWGADGALQSVVTLPFQTKPVTDRDKQVFLDAVADAARRQGAAPEAIQAFLQQSEFADHYPVFASLALGPEGSVWVQRVHTGDELVGAEGTFDIQDLGSSTWDVFDGDGRYLGPVTFPGKYQPIRAMGGRFYGVARDELDVQSLKVYRVVTR